MAGGAPGERVPAHATVAMLCVVAFDTGEVVRHQVLRLGVDRLVTAINELNLIDAPSPLQCVGADHIQQYSLVLGYPDRTVTTVFNDNTCGISFLPDGAAWSGT